MWQGVTMLSEVRRLTDRDLAGIAELEKRVIASDGGRLKLEWGTLRSRPGDRVDDLLWWEEDTLLGFVGLYAFGGHLELAGMVDPAARRRRVGSNLLDGALRLAAGRAIARVLLVVPRSISAGRQFAEARGAVLDHSEHFLVLGATPPSDPLHGDVAVREATSDDHEEIGRILATAFGGEATGFVDTDPSARLLVVERAGAVVGTLRINSQAGTSGIYGFAIDPPLQGRGIGRDVLRRVAAQVRAEGSTKVTLEVAVDNDRALGLYTSVGFEPRATEDYYALAVD
jgi:ribosomal protein S18 acetylase RimI-like enzyme